MYLETPYFRFEDRHIFVVGGSRGIGAASARLLGQLGAKVSLSYAARADVADQLASEIEEAGGQAKAYQVSVESDGSIDQAVSHAVSQFGPLHGMVISAGVFEPSRLEVMSTEFWDWMMAVNVRGTFLSVKAAAREMRASGLGGSIVIYTSTAGQRGSAEYSAYATSKGAQILFMRSMALELASSQIRVNCVAPAWTETDMAAPSLDAIGREKVSAMFPLGRIGQPEDVAKATTFLLSDLASFVTGTTVTVDGGMDMRG
jgi:3-oxoacyl-[acyl-carrier protein] reductase